MKKILIVDDDADILDSLAAILSAHFDVGKANHSGEALSMLEEQTLPDLILLDVRMRRPQEGFEFVRELSNRTEYKNIPVIIITSIEAMTASDATADIVRKTRGKYGVSDRNVLVLKSPSGDVSVDYKSVEDDSTITIKVDGYHSKPVNPDRLINEINFILK